MTASNPHPLANPLNQTRFNNFKYGQNDLMYQPFIKYTSNPSKLQVPNQDIPYGDMSYMNNSSSNLTVPNQDIPYDIGGQSIQNHGFINDRLFQMHDGTVIDFKTGKLFTKKLQQNNAIKNIESGFDHISKKSWNDEIGISFNELINNTDKYQNTALPNGHLNILEPLDPKSAKYWLQAQIEAEKLVSNMTDEQKALIKAFEQHFPKSKLIEESKKANI